MLAEQNPIIEDAVVTMYEMSAEDAIREQCWAREDYYRTLNTLKAHISNRDRLLEQKDKEVEQKEQEIEQKEQTIQQKNQEIERLLQEVERLKKQTDQNATQ